MIFFRQFSRLVFAFAIARGSRILHVDRFNFKGKICKKKFFLCETALLTFAVVAYFKSEKNCTVESEKLHSRRCVLFLHFSSFLRRENYHIVKKVSDRLAKLLQLIWYISHGTSIVAFLRLLSRHHKKVYFVLKYNRE